MCTVCVRVCTPVHARAPVWCTGLGVVVIRQRGDIHVLKNSAPGLHPWDPQEGVPVPQPPKWPASAFGHRQLWFLHRRDAPPGVSSSLQRPVPTQAQAGPAASGARAVGGASWGHYPPHYPEQAFPVIHRCWANRAPKGSEARRGSPWPPLSGWGAAATLRHRPWGSYMSWCHSGAVPPLPPTLRAQIRLPGYPALTLAKDIRRWEACGLPSGREQRTQQGHLSPLGAGMLAPKSTPFFSCST